MVQEALRYTVGLGCLALNPECGEGARSMSFHLEVEVSDAVQQRQVGSVDLLQESAPRHVTSFTVSGVDCTHLLPEQVCLGPEP